MKLKRIRTLVVKYAREKNQMLLVNKTNFFTSMSLVAFQTTKDHHKANRMCVCNLVCGLSFIC